MSLQNRVRQIAQNAVKSYISTQITITQNQTSSNSNLVGSIQSFDLGSMLYTVSYPDGSTEQVSPGGLRPLGPGDAVIISNGAIIG